MKWVLALALSASILSPTKLCAQENGPIIIPEKLQVIASDPKYALAERLGIKWDTATSGDTGRYLGMVAAAAELARSIAVQGGRKEAEQADFEAALSILCLYPPNKPPIVEGYWNKIIPAFFDTRLRQTLDASVRPGALTVSDAFQKGEPLDAYFAKFTSKDDYSKIILDLGKLEDFK